MSEPIPESIPTSADPRSRRPAKKPRLTGPQAAAHEQAATIESLFARPDRELNIPSLQGSNGSSNNITSAPGGALITKPSAVGPPPEIVNNVQGSSAGAGSGEFHVYKASRRREYERVREMEEEVRREKDLEVWEREKREREAKDEERTRKKREKRQKKGKKGGAGKDASATPSSSVQTNVSAGKDGDAGEGNTGAAVVEEVGIIIHDDD